MEAPVTVRSGSEQRPGARLRCDCGNVYVARRSHLVERNGRINTTSCGCAARESSRSQGLANTKTWVEAGQRIGRGVVTDPDLRVSQGAQSGYRGARLRCDCGTVYEARVSDLIERANGKITVVSCGCLRREKARESKNVKHGMAGHPLYHTWRGMMQRCYTVTHPKYPRYGGRGIAVCDAWHDPRVCIAWIEDNLGSRPAGMSLDRADVNGNYEPGNLQWATPQQQTDNREYQIAMSFMAWARTHHPEVVAEWGSS